MGKRFGGSERQVAIWIYIGVIMLIIQVILGGITRLTGSGLSITEWNIFTGTIPPLTDQSWLIEFEKYRNTPQFQLINTDFTLSDFKYIYFWEWLHRFWARFIGVVFLIPFIYFLLTKKFRSEMIIPLIILFLLGALQGAVGWIMVASGLVGDAIFVRPTRLALHFVFALVLIAYAFWFALQLTVPPTQLVRNRRLYKLSIVVMIILFMQLVYGALMAGHRAATAAPTFPDINGSWMPANITFYKPVLINLVENKITIHFLHRNLAYVLLLLIIAWTIYAFRQTPVKEYFKKTRLVPLFLIVFQAILGIITVISSPSIIPNEWRLFQWMAALHQVTGMLFMLSMTWMIYLTRPGKS